MNKGKSTLAQARKLSAARGRGQEWLESLETRTLFSAYVVTSTSDAAGVGGTLRDEIVLANASKTPSTITFGPKVFATAQTIKLNGTALDLTNTKESITITGPSAGLTISGNGASRVFYVNTFVTASITGVTITDGGGNKGSGGAVYSAGSLTLTHDTVSNSKSNVQGGGIDDAGKLTVKNCTISGNSSAGTDGGVSIEAGSSATITNSTISGNLAYSWGGGIDNAGTLVMEGDTVSGNHQSLSGGLDGGGVLTYGGKTTLINCTIANNKAVGSGGGVCNENVGTTNIYDCTISGNYTAENAGGRGGGVANLSGTINIANTIIAGNTVPSSVAIDVYGHFTSKGHNLVRIIANSTGWTSSDKTGTVSHPLSADLGPLANNGGPTLTEKPGASSPAIGGGSVSLIPSGITTDQRGLARIIGGKVDIGAVEIG